MAKKRDPLRAGLDQAKEKAGGPKKLSELCRVSKAAVSGWTRVPIPHVPTIESALGIPRTVLRPDVYAG